MVMDHPMQRREHGTRRSKISARAWDLACIVVAAASMLLAVLPATVAQSQEPSQEQPQDQSQQQPPEPSQAQDKGTPDAWGESVEIKKVPERAAPDLAAPPGAPNNTTVIERGGGKAGAAAGLKLMALLTADGQQIDQGLVWRVFKAAEGGGKSQLVAENREASPSLNLQPGEYTINAAFGRANLTRKITVKADTPAVEQFVLNAGGLRLTAMASGAPATPGTVTYAIYSDDRDQSDNRTAVMTGAKPNLIIRLNAGIYRIVSVYGDANAKIETDVTVEAGKLTETSVSHTGGKANFKLVTRTAGEAVPGTRWIIQTESGEIVKESVGALPSHVLAPGSYVAVASSGGQLFKNTFEVKDGEVTSVEVLMTGGYGPSTAEPAAPAEPAGQTDIELQPSLEFKNQ